MAASLLIEEETGTYVRTHRHPHNGYYAGDFGRPWSSRDQNSTGANPDRPSLRSPGSHLAAQTCPLS